MGYCENNREKIGSYTFWSFYLRELFYKIKIKKRKIWSFVLLHLKF